MIISFDHKGLERFYRTGSSKGIQAIHAARLREMLTALDAAVSPSDLARPSWRIHTLQGTLNGYYAMTVQANWRMTFRFFGQDVELLNYVDYH
jgi:toxin HigB-1